MQYTPHHFKIHHPAHFQVFEFLIVYGFPVQKYIVVANAYLKQCGENISNCSSSSLQKFISFTIFLIASIIIWYTVKYISGYIAPDKSSWVHGKNQRCTGRKLRIFVMHSWRFRRVYYIKIHKFSDSLCNYIRSYCTD